MAYFPSRRDLSFAVEKNFLTGCGIARVDMASAGGLPERKSVQQVFPGGLLGARHKEEGFQKTCLEGEWRGKKGGFCRFH